MLDWQGHLNQMIPAREARIHEKLKRKPEPGDVYRWKREMNVRELLVTEAFMGDRLSRLGYERRYNGLARPLLLLVQAYCRVVLPVVAFQLRVFRHARKRLVPLPASKTPGPSR